MVWWSDYTDGTGYFCVPGTRLRWSDLGSDGGKFWPCVGREKEEKKKKEKERKKKIFSMLNVKN